MKAHFRWFCLMAPLLLFGCAPVKSDRELLGSYRGKLPEGAVILTLLPNGECTQEISLKNGTTYSAHGRWTYDRKYEYLQFEGTRIPLDGFGGMNPKIAEIPSGFSSSLPVVRKLFGGFKIGLGEGVYYEKQRQ